VEGGGSDVLTAESTREPIGAALRPDEDQRELALGLQLLDKPSKLVLVRHGDETMLDLGRADVLRTLRFDAHRVVRERTREVSDLSVQRGREQHRLALRGQTPQKSLDLRPEAHVEHTVGFVEHEDPHVIERDGPALDEVLQSARRCDDDMRGARTLRLGGEWSAAVDGRDAKALRRCERRRFRGDLGGKLASRNEDEHRRSGRLGVRPLDDRQGERERLARARGRLRKHVATVERVRKHPLLNAERLLEAAFCEHLEDGRAQAERAKR
jgi:hypothetical protein